LYGSVLGEGAYARVLHVKHKGTDRCFAAKILDKRQIRKEDKIANVMMERNVMSVAQHHNVVRLYFTFQTKEELFFVMSLCARGDMFEAIQSFRTHARGVHTVEPKPIVLPSGVPLRLATFYVA